MVATDVWNMSVCWSLFFFFFFFQAEDGIRYLTVTGVQTCALPIWPRFEYANVGRVQVDGLELSGHARIRAVQTQLAVTLPRGRDLATGHRLSDIGTARRSEERRVGKECRARGCGAQYKEKARMSGE